MSSTAAVGVGTLYILTNRDKSLAKVGMTINGTPELRATDYEKAHGVFFEHFCSWQTQNVRAVEASVHRDLRPWQFDTNTSAREIFHTTPARAKAIALPYLIPLDREQIIQQPIIGDGQSPIETHLKKFLADILLLQTVVAVLVTQAEPAIKEQILAIMSAPVETIFKGGLDSFEGGRANALVQLFLASGAEFRKVLDHIAPALEVALRDNEGKGLPDDRASAHRAALALSSWPCGTEIPGKPRLPDAGAA
jgi:hypothetical protein